jgi:hypothetical protein
MKLAVFASKFPYDWAYILRGLSWVSTLMALYTLVDTKQASFIIYQSCFNTDA